MTVSLKRFGRSGVVPKAKLAILGGPAGKSLMEGVHPRYQVNVERRYLLDAHHRGLWFRENMWKLGRKRYQTPAFQKHCERLQTGPSELFRKEFSRFHTARYCSLVTNGTHTLQLALEALDIGWGDEVIVPGLTWQATASAVVDVNAVPVLVDIDPETFCIDPSAVERAVTRRTKAIIPVHLYGRCADLDAIMRIARRHRLLVIEDCAHAHGSRFAGRGVGSIGDLGSFSFQMAKTMNSAEGGALLTNNLDLWRRVESLRNVGQAVEGVAVHSGNYRLTPMQAGVLRGQLAWFREVAPLMDRFHRAFDRALAQAPGVRPLRRNKLITRQCGFGVGFRYERAAFDGLPGSLFRRALEAETGIAFNLCYRPLNNSEIYRPNTKQRVKISREYLDAIDPKRWNLPVAWDVYNDAGMIAYWHFSLMPLSRLGRFVDAIARIYDHRKELLANARELGGE